MNGACSTLTRLSIAGCVAASLGTACAAQPAPSPAPRPASAGTPPPAPSAPTPIAERDPPDATVEPPDAAVDPMVARINEDYATQTDARRWARSLEREGREVHDRRHEIIAAIELRAGSSVADIGAGTGLFSLDLAREVGRKGTVFAVDIHQYFLDHVSAKATAAGLSNLQAVLADQHDVRLPPGSLDVAFMCDVYHHIERPAAYLETVRLALRPGGRLVVIDYRRDDRSAAWISEHIRASPEAFRAEIEASGLVFRRSFEMLEDNFFYVFERTI